MKDLFFGVNFLHLYSMKTSSFTHLFAEILFIRGRKQVSSLRVIENMESIFPLAKLHRLNGKTIITLRCCRLLRRANRGQ